MTLHPVPFLVIFRSSVLPGPFAEISKQVIQWSLLCEPFKAVLALGLFFLLAKKTPQTNSVHYFSFVRAKERIGGKTEVDINEYDIHAVRRHELDAL